MPRIHDGLPQPKKGSTKLLQQARITPTVSLQPRRPVKGLLARLPKPEPSKAVLGVAKGVGKAPTNRPKMAITGKLACVACNGSGVSSRGAECYPCNGTGKIVPNTKE